MQKKEWRRVDLTVWVWGLLRGESPWLIFCGPAQGIFPSCFWGKNKLPCDRKMEAVCVEPLQNWTKLNGKVCFLSALPKPFIPTQQLANGSLLPSLPWLLEAMLCESSAGQQKIFLKTQPRRISFNSPAASIARSWPNAVGSWSWTDWAQIPAAPLTSYVPGVCM